MTPPSGSAPDDNPLGLTTTGEPGARVVLIIDDDAEEIPLALQRAGFAGRRLDGIAQLERYLKSDQVELDDPVAALVDVGLDPPGLDDWGLGAVLALRRAPATRRTGIILRTAFVKPGGEIRQTTHTDLHAAFCAAACEVGVLVAAKGGDDVRVTRAVQGMVGVLQGNPRATFRDIERNSSGLRLVEPLVLERPKGSKHDIVHVLLGNEPKRLLWSYLKAAEINPNLADGRNALDAALRKVYRDESHPSRTLDSLGEQAGEAGGVDGDQQYLSRLFLPGQIGDLAAAVSYWKGFLTEARLERVQSSEIPEYLSVPPRAAVETRGKSWEKFQSTYLDFLAHPDTLAFGEWYEEAFPEPRR